MKNFTIGEIIKSFRKENGYTQVEMARLLGVSKQALSNYERGKTVPNMAVTIEFSHLSGISLYDLTLPNRDFHILRQPDTDILEVISSFRSLTPRDYLMRSGQQKNIMIEELCKSVNSRVDRSIF